MTIKKAVITLALLYSGTVAPSTNARSKADSTVLLWNVGLDSKEIDGNPKQQQQLGAALHQEEPFTQHMFRENRNRERSHAQRNLRKRKKDAEAAKEDLGVEAAHGEPLTKPGIQLQAVGGRGEAVQARRVGWLRGAGSSAAGAATGGVNSARARVGVGGDTVGGIVEDEMGFGGGVHRSLQQEEAPAPVAATVPTAAQPIPRAFGETPVPVAQVGATHPAAEPTVAPEEMFPPVVTQATLETGKAVLPATRAPGAATAPDEVLPPDTNLAPGETFPPEATVVTLVRGAIPAPGVALLPGATRVPVRAGETASPTVRQSVLFETSSPTYASEAKGLVEPTEEGNNTGAIIAGVVVVVAVIAVIGKWAHEGGVSVRRCLPRRLVEGTGGFQHEDDSIVDGRAAEEDSLQRDVAPRAAARLSAEVDSLERGVASRTAADRAAEADSLERDTAPPAAADRESGTARLERDPASRVAADREAEAARFEHDIASRAAADRAAEAASSEHDTTSRAAADRAAEAARLGRDIVSREAARLERDIASRVTAAGRAREAGRLGRDVLLRAAADRAAEAASLGSDIASREVARLERDIASWVAAAGRPAETTAHYSRCILECDNEIVDSQPAEDLRGSRCALGHVLCPSCTTQYIELTLLPNGVVWWDTINCVVQECTEHMQGVSVRRCLPPRLVQTIEASQDETVSMINRRAAEAARLERENASRAAADRASEAAVAQSTKRCPNCGAPSVKINGCKHITCRCRHEYCWDCGRNWIRGHMGAGCATGWTGR